MARKGRGDDHLKKKQAQAELGRINREMKRLKAQTAVLEERKAKLMADLRK